MPPPPASCWAESGARRTSYAPLPRFQDAMVFAPLHKRDASVEAPPYCKPSLRFFVTRECSGMPTAVRGACPEGPTHPVLPLGKLAVLAKRSHKPRAVPPPPCRKLGSVQLLSRPPAIPQRSAGRPACTVSGAALGAAQPVLRAKTQPWPRWPPHPPTPSTRCWKNS
jgi:hypothetical protein